MTHWGHILLSRAVRNDAMKQDPPEIYGWRIILLALSVRVGHEFESLSACADSPLQASFGAMLFGME